MWCLPNPGDGCSSLSQRVYVYESPVSSCPIPLFPMAGMGFLLHWPSGLGQQLSCLLSRRHAVRDIVTKHPVIVLPSCVKWVVFWEWQKFHAAHMKKCFLMKEGILAGCGGGGQEVKGKHIWGDQLEMASFELHHLRGIKSLWVQG